MPINRMHDKGVTYQRPKKGRMANVVVPRIFFGDMWGGGDGDFAEDCTIARLRLHLRRLGFEVNANQSPLQVLRSSQSQDRKCFPLSVPSQLDHESEHQRIAHQPYAGASKAQLTTSWTRAVRPPARRRFHARFREWLD
jgi:hypothetical protein